MSPPRLVVGDYGIGDMVLSHSLLQTLKAHEPDSPIDLIATANNESIARLFPEVRKVLVRFGRIPNQRQGKFSLLHLQQISRRIIEFPGLLHQIKQRDYSKVYILRRHPKDMILMYLARIPQRIGYLRVQYSKRLLTRTCAEPDQAPHQSRSITRLGHLDKDDFEVPMPTISIPPAVVNALPRNILETSNSGNLVAIHPGGSLRDKKWPAASYGALATWLLGQGFQVVILGSANEQEQAQQIIDSSSAIGVQDFTGRLSLLDNMALLSRCRALISNDTGLMHAGAALGITVLGIFLITDPIIWHPLGPKAHYISAFVRKSRVVNRSSPPPTADNVIAKLKTLI